MQSVLHLSETLFDWDKNAESESVYFDDLHQHVIHQRSGEFSAFSIAGSASSAEGSQPITVQFAAEDLRSVRFSPDLAHFAYLCENKQDSPVQGSRKTQFRLACAEVAQPHKEPLVITSHWAKSDLEVLSFFWLPAAEGKAEGGGSADLVTVTSYGVELFRVSFEQRQIKSVKAFPTTVRMAWVEPLSGIVLVCSGPRTLQPFDLRAKTPQKMPKFDLILGRNKVIEAPDVAVMTIYDATFCIHCDGPQGRVSLRNISNKKEGTPEHDIVIDVLGEGTPTGTLSLSKVDNLLIVHCLEKNVSTLFDIRHKERNIVSSLTNPRALSRRDEAAAAENLSPEGWFFAGGSIVIDASPTGFGVRRLEVDMDGVLQELLLRTPNDLATVMRLLLRRTNCRECIVQTLRRALSSKTKGADLAQAFAVLNQAYRSTIEAVSKKAPSGPGKQSSVSLNELENVIGKQSILSEKDMVSQVFYPHFMATTPTAAPLGREGDSASSPVTELWHIALPEADAAEAVDGDDKSRPVRSPYIVSIVVAYLRSLLSMQILPHKILQCFVFDLCMFFHQEHTLQQFLHYHVLLDSTDLVMRLKNVSVKRNSAWATQSCLDMALRLSEFAIAADILLLTRQYLDIVPFLINQKVTWLQTADFRSLHKSSIRLRELC
jgi:hypothetical protein